MRKALACVLLVTIFLVSCSFIKPFGSSTGPTPDVVGTIASATLTSVVQQDQIFASPTPLPTSTQEPTLTPLPGAHLAAGDKALFTGDYEAAIVAYQEGTQSSNDPAIVSAALTGLGRVYMLSGDTDNALKNLRQVINEFPGSESRAEAFFYLAQVYEQINRPSDAADAYLNYLSLSPGTLDAFIHEKRGDLLTSIGNMSEALLEYQAALSSPRLQLDLSLEIKLARAYESSGDTATALVMYNDLYTRTTSDMVKANLDYLRGFLLASTGQTEAAQAAYLDAVQNFPSAYDSYLSLVELVNAGYPVDELQRGIVDYFAGQYGPAVDALDRYLANSPSDPARAYYYKGLSFQATEDSNQAVAMWDIVIQNYLSSEVSARAAEQKAYVEWAYLDDYGQAQKTLAGFVDSAPTHSRAAEFLFDAARIAERDDNLTSAIMYWERLAEEYPGSEFTYQALFNAGITEFRRKDYAASQAIFFRTQGTAKSASDTAAVLLWIGKTYQSLGDHNTALDFWRQAAEADPTGYYSERANDLLAGKQPFAPPEMLDLGYDAVAERRQAEDWLRQTFNLPAETNLNDLGNLGRDGRFLRGQEFWRLGLYSQAMVEFEELRMANQNDPAASFLLASAFNQLGAYRPAILAARNVLALAGMDDAATLKAPKFFNRIRFGVYFPDLVLPLAKAYNFQPLLVWSLMRQESFFDRTIVSPAGARGLMQIMPATGQDLALRLSWPDNFSESDLDRPYVSIRLGLDYLDSNRLYLDGDLMAALAAYNGGPGNARIWKDLAGDDPDLFVELIRLDEPRRYIKGIYEMYDIYAIIYGHVP